MIAKRLKALDEDIRRLCERTDRKREEIDVVLVTKTIPPESIKEAYNAGWRVFGENKVQEFCEKYDLLPAEIKWHFIGHLQRNKVKYIVDKVSLIHSVDSLRLAKEINKQAEKINRCIPILLQVNISKEHSKSGFAEEELSDAVSTIVHYKNVHINGLMTIGPFTEDRDLIRNCFQRLSQLKRKMQQQFSECEWKIISMGMSADYDIAIEEGATLLRIGSLVFGERIYT